MSNKVFFRSKALEEDILSWTFVSSCTYIWINDESKIAFGTVDKKTVLKYSSKEDAQRDLDRLCTESEIFCINPRLEEIGEKLDQLETSFRLHEEMLQNLWHCPGMPGSIAASQRFQKASQIKKKKIMYVRAYPNR